jgi:dipeptidyl aminopeptidase/acylaminoacyl peptidase
MNGRLETMKRRLSALALVLVCGVGSAVQGLDAQEFDLTIQNIMRGPELVGVSPGGFRWSPDSRYLYFRWQQPGVDTSQVLYRVRAGRTDVERVDEADADTVLAGGAVWTTDRRKALFVLDGDLVLWERGRSRYLTKTHERESSPVWSEDGQVLYYQRGGNVFAVDIEHGELRQLTDIRRGDPPRDPREPTGQRKFLLDQQQELFEFIRDGAFKRQPWNREAVRDTSLPQPFYPGEGKSVGGLQLTPDGAYVLMTVREPARDTRRIKMPLWITEDGYLDVYDGRPKVGDNLGKARAAVLEVETGEVTFVGDSIGEGDRDIMGLAVSPNSRHVLLRIETQDNERRWYVVVDLPSMETRVIDELHDEAWVSGPLSYTAGFLPGGESVYFGSERTGWAHLYLVPASGGEPTPLTGGEWEVLNARLSPDEESWYITANREGFQDVHFYTLPVRGGEMTRITTPAGRQNVTASPDGRWLAISHSVADHPGELFFQENRSGRDMVQVTESTTEEWRQGAWIKPEIVMVRARDGVEVPARLYRPQGDVAPEGQRPAVVFVHGAGYLQNVHNWWSSYYREYMFHHLLAAQGYTVLDMDYRGSAGHGRDWRTAIYRHMGGNDLTDHVDGAQWLMQNMGIDSTRIGIYGGSYGGFITLMAMFTTPGVFRAGAALRPVTDWAHYNHGYTSNILNEPQNDSTAYQQSSPIYFAEGLEGDLLICHGMLDDNVLFYDTVRLAQRLIELGKENWEVAMYPAERHGFQLASSWTDEYTRIFKLFERTLK